MKTAILHATMLLSALAAPTCASSTQSAKPEAQSPGPQGADQEVGFKVEMDTGEAEAVLSILDMQASGSAPSESSWDALWKTEGYQRLRLREESMKRPFTNDEFRQFVQEQALTDQRVLLRRTLQEWQSVDMRSAAATASAYLPKGTPIKAKVYPVIKTFSNSFVFEAETNPAIFLYLDPKLTAAQLQNTLAHELHHIGLTAACEHSSSSSSSAADPVSTVLDWTGAFGEGVAMLAAAGGPDRHPHAVSSSEDKARWDRDVARFDADLKEVEQFFFNILDGTLKEESAIMDRAIEFFGVQGPWYTVGWRMAWLVEKLHGRERLVQIMCDGRLFLATYNQAAEQWADQGNTRYALWSERLVDELGAAMGK